jgi:acyl dehydratase
MPWQDHVGKTKLAEPIEVDRARIEGFVRGVAETNPRHADPSRSDYAALPLFVATAVIPGTGAMLLEVDTGENLVRIVHGGIELHFKRLVREGDRIRCRATFQGIEEKSSGKLISFGFDVLDQDERSVCEGVTRYFVRGAKKPDGATEREAPPDPGPPTREMKEVVREGQSLLYAEGSGDHFPIHTDPAFAKSVGLPDVILHGMCTLAFSARAVVDAVLGGDASRLKSLGVRFSKMVFHGDELTTRLWVDGANVRFVTLNQRGQVVLDDGTATIA